MAKNILYITYDGLTDPLGQSQILPYIIGLSQQGFRFTILSAEKDGVYQSERATIASICKANAIDWQPVSYTKSPPILSTLKDIRKLSKKAESLHKSKAFSAVHCRSYIPAIMGHKLQKKYGLIFIFDMRGFWADERIDGHIWDLKKPYYRVIYNYFKKLEKRFLADADAIVSLTHVGKEIMQKEWQVSKPIFVIPCTVDTELFKPIKVNSKLRIKNSKLVLGYLGSIGTWYMLDEMLDFFKVLLEQYPQAIFKFITKEHPDIILQKAKQKQIDTNRFEIVSAKRDEVSKELASVDLGIFFIKPAFSKQASSPVKQGEFMAMGIPVITNSGVGDTDQIIEQYKSGLLISDFNIDAYKKAVQDIQNMLDTKHQGIVEGAHQYFSLLKGNQTYIKLYNAIIN